jgi:S1-C subfamily serine protease
VVSGAVTIEVYTQYRSQPYTAKLIGLSECDDLAVLKIDIKDSKYLVFNNSEPKLGQE